MRSATLVSLVASLMLVSQSPAAYAAPVPSQVNSVGEKRCINTGCRIAELPDIQTETLTDTTPATSQSEVQNLAAVLISALQNFQALNTPSNSNLNTVV